MEIKITAENKKARIEITGAIGDWYDHAEMFRYEVRKLKSNGATSAHLYIHSEGGDVFQAEEIVNILASEFNQITGEAGALVASAASRIAMVCKTFSMPANSLMMIHRPRAGVSGSLDSIKSTVEALEILDKNYRDIYAAKVDDVAWFDERWNSNTDIWLSAESARAHGFADKVTGKVAIDEPTAMAIAACGYTGKISFEKPKTGFAAFFTKKESDNQIIKLTNLFNK